MIGCGYPSFFMYYEHGYLNLDLKFCKVNVLNEIHLNLISVSIYFIFH